MPQAVAALPRSVSAVKPIRVLWIEDELKVINHLAAILERHGCVVDVELTGPDGLVRARRDVYDVIMLDMNLAGGMNGLEVLEQLRAENIATPVLVFTGVGTLELGFQVHRLGAVNCAAKPILPSVLIEALRQTAARVTEPVGMAVADGKGGIDRASRCCAAMGDNNDSCQMLNAMAYRRIRSGRQDDALLLQALAECLECLANPELWTPTLFSCVRAPHLVSAATRGVRPRATLEQFRSRFRKVTGSHGPIPPKVKAAIRRMQSSENQCRLLSEERVAVELDLSPTQLSRLLKHHTGLTFVQWRWMIQLRPAMESIIKTEESFARIAERCGYRDPSHFSREFRALFGLAPTEFRNIARQALINAV